MSRREEYIDQLTNQLKKWDTEIDKLEEKAGEMSAEAKVKYQEQLASWREQRDAAAVKMQELSKSSEAAWQEMSAGMSQAWDAMKVAFDKATQVFTKK
jgi:uncharacterized coiled-coil DUF342 family protein